MRKLRQEGVAWQSVDGQIVCLDLGASRYMSINEAGAALWPLLVEGAEPSALAAHLSSVFGIDDTTASRDVSTFLSELDRRALLEPL